MHDPLGITEHLVATLERASLERLKPFQVRQREALRAWFHGERGPMNDPVVEFDPPFEPAPCSWWEMVQEGLLLEETYRLLNAGGTIQDDRPPYLHQFEAIRAARTGRSLIVAAGTGSGKTECFLIPILDDLLREALPGHATLVGLRSMLVYPMNALVLDQLSRWRAILGRQQEILGWVPLRLGMYNSMLRTGERVGTELEPILRAMGIMPGDPEAAPYQPLAEGEVLDRDTMLAGGRSTANILITNYVMLEYALLRLQDQRWLSDAGQWRHVVLDEAHSYSGGRAVDLALLLRRLRDRINPARPPQGFATSATFGGTSAVAELTTFAATLFCQPEIQVEAVRGRRVALVPDPTAPSGIAEPYAALVEFLRERQDEGRIKPLYVPFKKLGGQLFPGDPDARVRLKELLTACSKARSSEGRRALLPHRLHVALRPPLAWPSLCLNPDCPGRPERHGFSWPHTGWVGMDPSDDQCPCCGGPMGVPVTCQHAGCNLEGILALEEAIGGAFPPQVRLRHLAPELQGAGMGSPVLLVPPSENDLKQPGEFVTIDAAGTWHRVERTAAHWVLLRLKVDEALRCPRCSEKNQENGLRGTWDRTFPGQALRLIALDALLGQLPPHPQRELTPGRGRRLLLFSDSRQGAAQLAPRLAFTHRVLFIRRWILDTLRAQGDPETERKLQTKLLQLEAMNADGTFAEEVERLQAQLRLLAEGLTLGDLCAAMAKDRVRLFRWARSLDGARFARLMDDRQHLPGLPEEQEAWESAWYGVIQGKDGEQALETLYRGAGSNRATLPWLVEHLQLELYRAVVREFCRPAGHTPTCRRLGLVRFAPLHVPGSVPELSALGLPPGLHPAVCDRLLDLLVDQRCVGLARGRFGPLPDQDEDWGKAHLGLVAKLIGSENRTFSLLSAHANVRRFSSYVTLLHEAFPKGDLDHYLMDFASAAWATLRFLASHNPTVFEQGGDWIQVRGEGLKVEWVRTAQLCPRCGAVEAQSPTGRCSASQFEAGRGQASPCGANLQPFDPQVAPPPDLDAWPHARNRLLVEAAPEGLTAFEHTAQRRDEGLRRDELLFRREQMNVLSSSTTLEMGVDLPDLDAVALIGVPPGSTNHTQRVGRAGRRRTRSCLALTLAAANAFDRWAFRDPMAFLGRPGLPPHVDLKRERCLEQHFTAWRLGELIVAGFLAGVGRTDAPLRYLKDFAGIDEETRSLRIERWNTDHPDHPWTDSRSAPGWGDWATEVWPDLDPGQWERALALIPCTRERLQHWLEVSDLRLREELDRIRTRYADLRSTLTGEETRMEARTRWLLKSLRQYECLEWLAEHHLLPRYGFPVSVVRLTPPRPLQAALKEGIERERRMAIFEWSPGSQVVVSNRVWKPVGLHGDDRRGESKPIQARLYGYARCARCEEGSVHPINRPPEVCPFCNGSIETLDVAVPYGFQAGPNYQLAGLEAQVSTEAVQRIITLEEAAWKKAPLVFHPDALVAFLNLGQGKGFHYCGTCFGLRPVKGPWTPCRVQAGCSAAEQSRPIALGDIRHLDLLHFAPTWAGDFQSWRSAVQALKLSAAFLLEMDPRDLAISRLSKHGPAGMDLIDLTDGGTGMLAKLVEPVFHRGWLQYALDLAMHRSDPSRACVRACPECLISHDNRWEHTFHPFDRRAAANAIQLGLALLT